MRKNSLTLDDDNEVGKNPLDGDDDGVVKSIFICSAGNSMVDETQCKRVGKVLFLAQTQQMKVTVNAEPALVATMCGVPIT